MLGGTAGVSSTKASNAVEGLVRRRKRAQLTMQDSATASLASEVSLFAFPMMPLLSLSSYSFQKHFLCPFMLSFLMPFILNVCHLVNCLEYSNEVFGSSTCFYDYFIFVSPF